MTGSVPPKRSNIQALITTTTMWKQKSQSTKPHKSYDYFKRVKAFRDEIREMKDFLQNLEDRCTEIVEREDKRLEKQHGVK